MKDKHTETTVDDVDSDWLEKIENPVLKEIEKSGNIESLMHAVAEGKVDPRAASFVAQSMISNRLSMAPQHGW